MLIFLDANALFSDWQRAIWLALANSNTDVQLHHSELVLQECFRNLVRLGHLTAEGADIVSQQWQQHPSVHCVDSFDAYLADVRSVQEKDRHVAAAALKVRHVRQAATVHLLTWNIRDFPKPPLKRVGLLRLSPDEFLLQMFKQDADATTAVLAASLQLAQQHRNDMGSALSAYQQRASGFPREAVQWPDFLRRTGFRQLANAIARANGASAVSGASGDSGG